MNEAAVVRKIRKELPPLLYHRAVIFKHADSFTAGIPDLTITYGGHTHWLEVKYFNQHLSLVKYSELHKKIDQLQLATLGKLESQGKALYVIQHDNVTGFYQPLTLVRFFNYAVDPRIAEPAKLCAIYHNTDFKAAMTWYAERLKECATSTSHTTKA